MKLDRERAALVVVDVQEAFRKAIPDFDEVAGSVATLVEAAGAMGIPIVVTEQYPKGLGRTLPELRVLLDGAPAVEKTSFSACGAAGFTERLSSLAPGSVILTGIEAHVCVLLTALDLLKQGSAVSIVADAVCSRRAGSMDLGLGQARQAGAVITSTETVVFQLLGGSDGDAFREISKLLR